MNKGQFILGKKVVALLLLIVVLSTYMPLNLVYGVSDAISSEPETNTVVENTLPTNEVVNNTQSEEIINDAPNEQTNNVVENNTEATQPSVPVVEENKIENQDVPENNSENNVVVDNGAQKEEETQTEVEGTIEETTQNKVGSESKIEDSLNSDVSNTVKTENELENQEEIKQEDENQVENTTEEIENNNNLIDNKENLDNEEGNVNSITVNRIVLSGNITWIDNQNSYGTRPSSIKVSLIKNDEATAMKDIEVIPDATGNWIYNFQELDEQDENGVNITYKITTNGIENYNVVIDENNNIKSTLVGKTEVVGGKVWKDNSNAYGTRPAAITVNLYKNTGTVLVNSTSVTADNEGNWNYKFENLEKYDENGVLIDYQVKENEIAGYETVQEGTNFVSKLVGTTELKGTITWEDQENKDSTRPELIYVNLIRNGDKASLESYAINADEEGNWNYNFENLEKYDENGIEINYSITIGGIENYKSIVEKLSQTEFNITNVYSPKVEMNLTWQDILSYGPYISMNVKYAEEYGLELSQEEMYIYEKYQEMIYVKGPELAAIAMFEGTESFTEEEIAIYKTYQEIVLNGGEKSPISTLAEMGDTGKAIKNNGTPVLAYLCCYESPVRNSIKYVTSVNKNAPEKGNRVAYCVNYDRSYENSATYDGTSWDKIVDKYEPVYLRLYSELSYLVSIGCKEYEYTSDSAYSTGKWKEDYYATQTVIYNVIYDYTGYKNPKTGKYDNTSLATLQGILRDIKAKDSNALKIDPNNINDVIKVADKIRETFTGHPGGDETTLNSAYSRSQQVKNAVTKMYNAVTDYRNNIYSLDNADGYAASITITDISDFEFVEKSNGESYYEVIVTVDTTGKLNTGISVTATGRNVNIRGTRIDETNQYKITIPKDKIGNQKNFTFTASADFDMSRTITYISEVDGTQNVAFYQTDVDQDGMKMVSNTKTGPNTYAINGSKTWKDNNNSYGTRPSSIKIKLLSGNTVLETKTVTPDANGNWTWSFTNYPNQTGYTIEEEVNVKYVSTVNGYNVTNTLTDTTEVSVTKQWKDNSNKYSTRPSEITVNLLRNGTIYRTEKLNSSKATDKNTWKYTFTELSKYDSNGKLYNYTISEGNVQSAKTEVGTYKSEVNGTTIINTLVGKVELGGEKTWKDNNNAYGTRPNSIRVELLENGVYNNKYIDVEENQDKKWLFLFSELDKFDQNGKEIEYRIKENPSIGSNYEVFIDGNNLVNKLVGKVKVSVVKVWNDDNNHHDTRPEYITVNLLADNVQVDSYNLTEADNWSHTFEDLEKYTSEGVKILYTISETAIVEVPAGRYVTTITEGAASTEDDKQYELTNCLTDEINIKGAKIWKDNNNEYGTRPETITIKLYRENKNVSKEYVQETTISADSDGNWGYEFIGLPKYDAKGVKYDYTVEENVIPEHEEGHYVDTYKVTTENHEEKVIDITNRLTGTTELGGGKTWKDNNNAYGTRPDSIIVNLLANGEKVQDKEVTEGESGNWNFFFANLVKFDEEGKKIEYSISENDVINYVGKVENTNITNTLIGTTEVQGIKIWHDSDNDYETRPESIIVKLLANGKVIDKKSVKADENGEWKFAFENLDEYDSEGVKIEYTVDEVPIDRYATDIKGTTIINTLIHNHVDLVTLTNLDSAPKTGKKNLLTVFSLTALMSLVGMFIVSKKEEDKF